MDKVTNIRSCAIIGCGNVGAATAYALMHSKLLSKMVLIDVNKKKAMGEAEDISHSLPFNAPMEIIAGDYEDISDCGIVIITAGVNQTPGQTRIDLLQKNAQIFRSIVDNIVKYNREAVILVVTNPVDVLTYITLERSGLPSSQDSWRNSWPGSGKNPPLPTWSWPSSPCCPAPVCTTP